MNVLGRVVRDDAAESVENVLAIRHDGFRLWGVARFQPAHRETEHPAHRLFSAGGEGERKSVGANKYDFRVAHCFCFCV